MSNQASIAADSLILYEKLLKEVESYWIRNEDKPEETPQAILHALWLTAAGIPISATRAVGENLPESTATHLEALRKLLHQHRQQIPLAHLTGRQNFMELEFPAGPEALIPRRE